MDHTPTVAEALAAVRAADEHLAGIVAEAARTQSAAADTRALAVAHLVDVAGREGAADALGISKSAIDKATQRVKAIRREAAD
jgi:hypothetical protein